jgi:N-acetyl-anhydromuramyl-L-alanine amidase AmpD
MKTRPDIPGAQLALSPHHNARRHTQVPKVVVLHADASPSEWATIGWLQHPDSKVSYHVLIGRTGTVHRIVPDTQRAWANGKSRLILGGTAFNDVNNIALNLAFANRHNGIEPLTTAQIAAAQGVVAWWGYGYDIDTITTHAAIAVPLGRKTDPVRIPNFALNDYPLRPPR